MISSILLSCLLAAAAPLLVCTEDLSTLENVSIVDGRNSADFAAGHIHGAVHLDADTLSEIRDGIHGLLKPLDQLHQIVGDAGINPEKHVVIYSDMADPEKRVKATRVFWALQYMGFTRLSLLDGGIGKWKAEKRPLNTGAVRAEKVVLSGLVPRPELLADQEDVKSMLREGTGVVADLRPAAFFTGDKVKDYVSRKGHITGACSLPNEELFTGSEFVFKTPEALEQVYDRRGVKKDTRLITYCNSGQAASVGYFATLLLGNENTTLYDGSMAEWAQTENAPVSTEAPE